jgi:hypothetical protein
VTKRPLVVLVGALLAAPCVAAAGEIPREELEARLMRLEAQLMQAEVREVAGSAQGGPDIASLERGMRRLRRDLRRTPRSEVADQWSFFESLEARLTAVRTGTQAPAVGSVGTGSISGTVRDAATSAAIPNVYVYVYKASCGEGSPTYVTGASTNASGVYTTAANLDSGDYILYTYISGSSSPYIGAIYGGGQCVGSCSSYAAARTGAKVTVTSPGATTGIDFALRAGGQIAGTLTNETTLAGVAGYVDVFTETGRYAVYTYANAAGFYTTPGLPAGTYFVASEYNGELGVLSEVYNNVPCSRAYCSDVRSGTPVAVVAGVTTPNINFSLTPGARITGQVLPAGSSAEVDVYDTTGSYVAYGYADGSGSYQAGVLRPGTYYARTYNWSGYVDEVYNNKVCLNCSPATTGDPVTVAGAADVPGINFDLATGGRVSGTINGGGAACANCELDLYDSSGRYVSYGYTNASGSYTTYRGLPTGSYYAKAYRGYGSEDPWVPQVWNGIPCVECAVTSGNPISVTQGQTTANINFNLAAGSQIGGTITDALSGASLGGASASLYSSSLSYLGRASVTCPTGSFASSGLTAGSYYVAASGTAYRGEFFSNVDCGVSCSSSLFTAVAVNGSTNATASFGLVRFSRRGDMNADNRSDLVWRETAGALYIWQMQGVSLAGSSYLPPISTNWVVQAVADFDGDLNADMLWRDAGSGATYMWLMSGPRKVGEGYTASQADNTWTIQGTGDFDGDGRSDIVWRHTSGALYIWTMKGTAVASAGYLPPISLAWTIQRLADFDGDGRADILWRETTSGATYLWLMNGATAIGQGYTASQTDNSWVIQGAGDLGGDGRADIVWRQTSGALYIWQMNGTAVTSSSYLPPISTNWVVKGIADYSGDGRSDIVWRETASGATYMWLMNGATKTGEGYTQGQASNNWTITTQP